MIVKNITQTCGACPSQWEGNLKDGRMFYARYRRGCLSIEISKEPTNDVYMAIGRDGDLVYNKCIGNRYDSVLCQSELVRKDGRSRFRF